MSQIRLARYFANAPKLGLARQPVQWRESQVIWCKRVDELLVAVVIAYFQDVTVCYSSVYDIFVMITRFDLELPAS